MPNCLTPRLYDMAGNVWEWMESGYGFGFRSMVLSFNSLILTSISDKRFYALSAFRSLRGGSWYVNADALRCSSRSGFDPRFVNYLVGFRVIRSSHSSA